jgi:hypothetical protein
MGRGVDVRDGVIWIEGAALLQGTFLAHGFVLRYP